MHLTCSALWIYLTAICCFWACQMPKSSSEKLSPNIVIILADDQGWGDLSLNGNPLVETPNIDAIAASGAVLEHFYVSAVCSPTRAEMLTGRHAARGGVYSTSAGGERLDLDEETFAKVFQEAGYATGAFGKWHNGMQYPYHPNARGFDEFLGYCSGHWGSYVDAMLEHNGEWVQSEGYLTDILTGKAIEFMEAHQGKPFLVYLSLNTPHSPMQVVAPWWEKFETAELPEHRYSEREYVDHSRAAYAMTENIDWNVGRVTTTLEKLGMKENTIVIYFSDNGPNGWRWNGGMEGIKGSVNEGGVRSPFIIRWLEKIAAGKRIADITSVRDLFPTLLEFAAISYTPQKPLDGKSIAPLLLEVDPAWEERLLINHWRDRTSIRSQHFRLDPDQKLFDMDNDSGQTEDVSADFPEIYTKMISAKEDWERTILFELPEEDNRPFPLGHPDFVYTQLPARDGIAHGTIERSNRWPNCSFYTHWTSVEDSITWEIEVLSRGTYSVELLYTCKPENVGTILALRAQDALINIPVIEAFDPQLRGMEYDKFERGESYVKDWASLDMGEIQLKPGIQNLTLKATDIPGEASIDFRLLMVRRVE